jgi:putative glutamine amidotransferase
MSLAPFVLVTATTELVRGRARVRVNEAYTNALAAVGLVPAVLPPVAAELAVAALTGAAGLVLTGGEDVDPALFGQEAHAATGAAHAARDSCEIALAREAFVQRIPTLAICRGAQVLNVALGGTLIQDIPSQYEASTNHDQSARRAERVHEVAIERDSMLAGIVGAAAITTNSSHHQSVDGIAPALRAVARSPDGIIEALEPFDPAWWLVAVQWHPEELTATPEAWDRRLFAAFADAVRDAGRD